MKPNHPELTINYENEADFQKIYPDTESEDTVL